MRRIAVVVALAGCSSILGFHDVTLDDSGSGSVIGQAVITHVLTSEQIVDTPRDLSSFEIRAYIPDPSRSSGFRIISGTGDDNGNVIVDGLPEGTAYYLKMTDLSRSPPVPVYYVTDHRDLDLGFVSVGRPDGVPATLQTQVTLNLVNMQAWSNADTMFMDSFGNGSEKFIRRDGTNDGNVLNMPVAGATAIGITFDWLSGYTYDSTTPRLIDASKMDDFWAAHTASSSISDGSNRGYARSTITDVFSATDVSMIDGHALTISGAFRPVPQIPMQSLSLPLTQLTPAFVDGGRYYDSDFACDRIKNWAVQYGNHIGPPVATFSGHLATATGTVSFAPAAYGDPYPSSWQSLMWCTVSHYRLLKLPGAVGIWRTVNRMQQSQPASDAFSAAVFVHPPDNIKVAGIAALGGGAAPFDGEHPVTVSWDAQPSVAHYILDVFHVTLNVNATQLTLVGALHTAKTSIDVPAEILVAGDFYLFDVIAVRDPNSYILGHLLRSGFPTGTGSGVTGLMRLSSSCGNGVVDPGESCDTGGNSATCDADCSPAICGDGFVNPAAGESCDNILDSPTCDADCTVPVCGDNHWNRAVEQCDDGNLVSGDGCSSTCHLEHCGDGHLDPFEDCDDGNHINGDGCNAFCVRE